MAEELKAQVETAEAVEQTLDTTETTDNGQEKSYKQIIKDLLANGWKAKKNLRVRNVTITKKESYDMLTFVVEPPVAGYIINENGDYVEGTTNNIYSSTFAVSGVLKETLSGVQSFFVKPGISKYSLNV